MSDRRATRVLVTGASGLVGGLLIRALRDRYGVTATDRRPARPGLDIPFVQADINDETAMRRLCEGTDVVIHNAADPRVDAPWDSLLANNINGAHAVFHAAAAARCRRVVFMSSIQAAIGQPANKQQVRDQGVRPASLYGVSKVASEALARFLADSTETSFICLRLGWVCERSRWRLRAGTDGLDYVITDRDLVALVVAAIEAPSTLRFGLFYGSSDNRIKAVDIETTKRDLGYQPLDDSYALAQAASNEPVFAAWPTAQEELLLQAALYEDERALPAWRAWEADVDWEGHIEDASYRLLPLVYDNLLRGGFDQPIMQRLKGIYRLAWYRNQTGLARLGGLLRALREAGIATMVPKGSALVVTHYESYGLRPMSDGGIVVKEHDAAAAIDLLTSHGWTFEPSPVGVALNSLLAARHAVALKDAKGNEIDLHWHVLQENCHPGADQSFWEGSVEIEIAGERTRALNATDQLLHVCVHGARWNELPSIRWVADAIMILRHSPAIDWDRLLRQAQDRLLVLPLRSTISYLTQVFEAPIPDAVLARLRSDAVSVQEQLEFRYRSRDHRSRLLGYLPLMWFDYLRTRTPLATDNRVVGFATYMKDRVGAPSWLLLAPYLLMTSPRFRRLVGR